SRISRPATLARAGDACYTLQKKHRCQTFRYRGVLVMRGSTSSAFTVNLKSLECFRATVDQGTVSAAAHSLRITQPAVSRLLRVLEEAAGFELFYRRTGRLIATDEALRVYKEVDVALDSIERVSELVKN